MPGPVFPDTGIYLKPDLIPDGQNYPYPVPLSVYQVRSPGSPDLCLWLLPYHVPLSSHLCVCFQTGAEVLKAAAGMLRLRPHKSVPLHLIPVWSVLLPAPLKYR